MTSFATPFLAASSRTQTIRLEAVVSNSLPQWLQFKKTVQSNHHVPNFKTNRARKSFKNAIAAIV